MHQTALVLTRATNAGYKNALKCSVVPSAILCVKFITRHQIFSKHFVLLRFFLYSRDLLFYINVSWICGYFGTIIQIKGSLFAVSHIRCIPKTKPKNTFCKKIETTYFQVHPPKFKLFAISWANVAILETKETFVLEQIKGWEGLCCETTKFSLFNLSESWGSQSFDYRADLGFHYQFIIECCNKKKIHVKSTKLWYYRMTLMVDGLNVQLFLPSSCSGPPTVTLWFYSKPFLNLLLCHR